MEDDCRMVVQECIEKTEAEVRSIWDSGRKIGPDEIMALFKKESAGSLLSKEIKEKINARVSFDCVNYEHSKMVLEI